MDIQSKVCYIYDYFHDNQPDKNVGMTYEDTTKTKIDAKFIIKSSQSLDKDQVEYYLQFKPSQKTYFSEDDELYYFETDYRRKYHNDDFVGLYCDIPDDQKVYHKWLICYKEIANQFVKYLILPCDFQLMWIERGKQERLKRKMWGAIKSQSSYNSGIYTWNKTTKVENQDKIWLPLNPVTEKIWYTTDDNKNMRVLVGALTEHPLAWIISKEENIKPLGIQKLTFYQSEFNPQTDYVNLETGEMFADYYDSNIKPIDKAETETVTTDIYGKIVTSTSNIKAGGTFKALTMELYDSNNVEITNNYCDNEFHWSCYIVDDNVTIDLSDMTAWADDDKFNRKKIKLNDSRDFLGKLLQVKCAVPVNDEVVEAVVQLEIIV